MTQSLLAQLQVIATKLDGLRYFDNPERVYGYIAPAEAALAAFVCIPSRHRSGELAAACDSGLIARLDRLPMCAATQDVAQYPQALGCSFILDCIVRRPDPVLHRMIEAVSSSPAATNLAVDAANRTVATFRDWIARPHAAHNYSYGNDISQATLNPHAI